MGRSDLELAPNQQFISTLPLGDSLAFPIDVEYPTTTIDINPNDIPEPATLIGSLIALAAAAKGYQTRRSTGLKSE